MTTIIIIISAVPGQPSIEQSFTMANSVSLSWRVPTGSVVISYDVEWSSGTWCPGGKVEASLTLPGDSTSHVTSDLTPGTWCNISVTAGNSAGTSASEKVSFKLDESGKKETMIFRDLYLQKNTPLFSSLFGSSQCRS